MRWFALVVLVAGCATSAAEGDGDCTGTTEDCNGDSADGCEADLTSTDNCGNCGTTCDAPSGATATCDGVDCGFRCAGTMVRCGDECLDRCAQLFDTPGTASYQPPVGCDRLRIKVWGAGGGHGAANTGAAAGGYSEIELAIVDQPLLVLVGAPGENAPGSGPGSGGEPGGGNGGSSDSQGGGGGGGYSGVFTTAVGVDTVLAIAGGGRRSRHRNASKADRARRPTI